MRRQHLVLLSLLCLCFGQGEAAGGPCLPLFLAWTDALVAMLGSAMQSTPRWAGPHPYDRSGSDAGQDLRSHAQLGVALDPPPLIGASPADS